MAGQTVIVDVKEQGAAQTEKAIRDTTEAVDDLTNANEKLNKKSKESTKAQKEAEKASAQNKKGFQVLADTLDNLGLTGLNSLFGLADGIGEVKGGFDGLKTAVAASGLFLLVELMPVIVDAFKDLYTNITGTASAARELTNQANQLATDLIQEEFNLQVARLRNSEKTKESIRDEFRQRNELRLLKIEELEVQIKQTEDLEERTKLLNQVLKLTNDETILRIEFENEMKALADEQAKKEEEEHNRRVARQKEIDAARRKAYDDEINRLQFLAELERQISQDALADFLEVKEKEKMADLNAVGLDEFGDLEEGLDDEEEILFNEREQRRFETKKKFLDGTLAAEQEAHEKSVQMATDAGGALVGLINAFGDQSEASARRQFERNKKVGIAQALINTFMAMNAALTAGGNPLKVATGAQFVEAGIALTTGLANVAKIAQTQFEGGGGASASTGNFGNTGGGGAQVLTPGNLVPDIPTADQTPIQTYVVEQDITDSQSMAKEIRRRATL